MPLSATGNSRRSQRVSRVGGYTSVAQWKAKRDLRAAVMNGIVAIEEPRDGIIRVTVGSQKNWLSVPVEMVPMLIAGLQSLSLLPTEARTCGQDPSS